LRIPFIAAIILFVNARKPEFTPEILTRISEALQKQINAGAWRNVKLYMRLLCCLQTLFEGDGIFPLLEQFFERAADLQMQSSEDVSVISYWFWIVG
jgi:nuclear cap-binding protein subunit 1